MSFTDVRRRNTDVAVVTAGPRRRPPRCAVGQAVGGTAFIGGERMGNDGQTAFKVASAVLILPMMSSKDGTSLKIMPAIFS